MEVLLFFLILLFVGLPTLFFLLNRELFQKRSKEILEKLQHTEEKVESLEQKLKGLVLEDEEEAS